MLSTVLRTIATRGLCAPGDRLLVAASGGPDSMALLHALWELRARLDLSLEVVGVDHGLRPTASGELDLVEARADALGLPFSRVSVDVGAARRRGGASLQDAARRARLEALGALAEARGAARVALGHQADDQAETVLFRILRGTGLEGLRGIPYRRGPFIRPLLDLPRAEILRYLQRRSIPFVEDPSNADLRFARARLRQRVLPSLRAENPRVSEALVGLAAAARGERDSTTIPALSRRAGAAIDRLRARGGTSAVDLVGARRAVVSYGQVSVEPRLRAVGREAERDAAGPLEIDRPGAFRWSDGVFEVREISPAPAGRARSVGLAAPEFDADCLAWPLVVRPRRPGDRMRPRGGRGSRKLSDLMIDAKIRRGAREVLPVVTTARGEVLFVPGLRPAELGRPGASTRRVVELSFCSATSV